MHEQAIAQEIITRAKRQETDGSHVAKIVLKVGEVAHLPGHELQEAIQTLMPHWQISIQDVKAVTSCSCGHVGEPIILEKGHDHNLFSCSSCRSLMPKVLFGDTIVLESVTLDEAKSKGKTI